MSILNIHVHEVTQAISILHKIFVRNDSIQPILHLLDSATFSQVSGLREAGDKHATIAGTHNPHAFDTHIANIDVAANLLKTCTDHVI